MLHPKKIIFNILIMCAPVGLQAADLGLLQTEEAALQFDPVLKAQAAELQAIEEEKVATDAWPDPRLKLGVMSVPVDTYALDQEAMTQVLIGYEQMLPRGDSRSIAVQKKNALSQQQRAAIELRQRGIKQVAREAWLDVFWQEQTAKILETSQQIARQQLDVSQSLYASGRNNQQDVLQADLEVSLVDDKLLKVESASREARARLAKLIGENLAIEPINNDSEMFAELQNEAELRNKLKMHPLLRMQDSSIHMREQDVALAEQSYKPQWGFEVTYGAREIKDAMGEPMPDLLSVMVNLDLPIFTSGLQDRELSASRKMLHAKQYEKQDVLLELTARFDQVMVRWNQLQQRLELYNKRVLNQARLNARAALKGYQSGVVPFATLTQARNAELDAQMRELDLKVEKAKLYAEIQFLTQETELGNVSGDVK